MNYKDQFKINHMLKGDIEKKDNKKNSIKT
jgi:hypothetical protein